MPGRSAILVLLATIPLACSPAPPRTDADVDAIEEPGAPSGRKGSPTRVAPDASQTPRVPPPPPSARLDDEQNTIDVFRAAASATVFVTQKRVVRDVWSMRALEVPAGSGTGFVWD